MDADLLEKARAVMQRTRAEMDAEAPAVYPRPALDATEGRLVAVCIASEILNADIWFAFDDGFKSGDDIPVFFAGELPFLRKMSESELRRRYEQKLTLGGGWIRDRIEEPTKH